MKYNGWTNYETWKTNLELVEGGMIGGDELADMVREGKDRGDMIDEVARRIEDTCWEITNPGDPGSFTASVISSFFDEVNWQEIAVYIVDGYLSEQETE